MDKTEHIQEDIHIDICICTFRRPHVAETIRSVMKVVLQPNWKLHIIVADNDESASAMERVKKVADETGADITYVHAPAFNISIARNACLNAATSPLLVFIDDDELVTSGWLEVMMVMMEGSTADVVLGPVCAVYEASCPEWIRQGDFHSTRPVYKGDEITTGYSGNVLIRRESLAVKGMRFRTELGAGGEDTAFFSSIYEAGGLIVFAPGAIAMEKVPHDRTNLHWLIRRHFRAGQTHGMLLLERIGGNRALRAKNRLLALTKLVFCFVITPLSFASQSRMAFWLLRGTLHVGVFQALSHPGGAAT